MIGPTKGGPVQSHPESPEHKNPIANRLGRGARCSVPASLDRSRLIPAADQLSQVAPSKTTPGFSTGVSLLEPAAGGRR